MNGLDSIVALTLVCKVKTLLSAMQMEVVFAFPPNKYIILKLIILSIYLRHLLASFLPHSTQRGLQCK